LLNNGNVVFGRASQVGPNVVIDGNGGRMSIGYQQVACWAGSLQELYRYRVDHRSGDPDTAIMRDVKWCLRYGLIDEARFELSRLIQRNPAHREANILLEQTQKTTHQRFSPTHPTIQQVRFDQATPSKEPHVDVDAAKQDEPAVSTEPLVVQGQALSDFTKLIQPTLINHCGRCHSAHVDSSFRLTYPSGRMRPSASMTQRNLAAISGYVQSTKDGEPSLLWYATNPHGAMSSPVFNQKDLPAERNLREWLQVVVGRKPTGSPQVQVVDTHASDDQFESWETVSEQPSDAGQRQESLSHRMSTDAPSRLPRVADPFDPERFNRLYHR